MGSRSRTWMRWAVVASAIAALVGCRSGELRGDGGGSDAGPELYSGSTKPDASSKTTEAKPKGSGSIASPASTGVRRRRRMDIDQLDASIRRVTGGIGWDHPSGDSMFVRLSQTLGKPDFADTTKEKLTPSPVFQKFLGDAARSVCRELANREKEWSKNGKSPEKRHLLVHASHEETYAKAPEAIERNLQTLLLNFHGRHVERGSAALKNWTTLFRRASDVAGDPIVAWRTVCVTLIRHPDFYTY